MLRHCNKDSMTTKALVVADRYECLRLLHQLFCHPQVSYFVAQRAAPAATFTFAFQPLGKRNGQRKSTLPTFQGISSTCHSPFHPPSLGQTLLCGQAMQCRKLGSEASQPHSQLERGEGQSEGRVGCFPLCARLGLSKYSSMCTWFPKCFSFLILNINEW